MTTAACPHSYPRFSPVRASQNRQNGLGFGSKTRTLAPHRQYFTLFCAPQFRVLGLWACERERFFKEQPPLATSLAPECLHGRYLVRFYSDALGRYCYVNEGSMVSWEVLAYNRKRRRLHTTINSNNSERYYVDHRFFGDKKPTSNCDIDHFLAMKDGSTLAMQVDS